jgi:hypothetical protein
MYYLLHLEQVIIFLLDLLINTLRLQLAAEVKQVVLIATMDLAVAPLHIHFHHLQEELFRLLALQQ